MRELIYLACKRCGTVFSSTSKKRVLCDGCTQNQPFESRFWSKVTKTESCWIWIASLDGKGYGQVNIGGKPQRAHRVAWTLSIGPISDGLFVCHHCDNARCVNPDHLFVGTAKDNIADMDRKARRINAPSLGEQHGCHILTECQALDVRERAISGERYADIACSYGISPATVSAIKTGRLWRHI